jgi:hypothetical protein
MFLGILAAIALTAGTVQTVSELEYVDAMQNADKDSAVVEVIETPTDIHQTLDIMNL